MVSITLPDNRMLSFSGPVSGADVASAIGAGLAKAAIAARVNDEVWDLERPIEHDARVALITLRDDDDTVYDLLRHDCAHVLAEAVQELYPETQVTIGPNVEDGFYYDFSRDEPFTPEDLVKIEARMMEIVARDEPVKREIWGRSEAVQFFQDKGEHYKAEIIHGLPKEETVTLYRQGEFVDLCRGPHLPSTGKLGTSFKLMKVAGAYWRGDSSQ